MVNTRNGERLEKLDPNLRGKRVEQFAMALRKKIVGQDEAVQSLVDFFQIYSAGLCAPGRPIANFLFLGPTGCGKTRIVEAAAEVLFTQPNAVIKIDCAEFQHGHEVAKLIGSPPGYLGHRETHPMITQEALDASHTPSLKLSFVLFDEIEKASDTLWQLLLGVLDRATLTLGDNRKVNFSNTMVFMTSNLGGQNISELMSGGYGFVRNEACQNARLNQQIEETALGAARRRFSPEFMNRIDRAIAFRPLTDEQLGRVLEIELGLLQQRLNQSPRASFSFSVSAQGREFLLREGTDQCYGARHLKRAVARHLVNPLASLISTQQVETGEHITIHWDGSSRNLEFYKDRGPWTFHAALASRAMSVLAPQVVRAA